MSNVLREFQEFFSIIKRGTSGDFDSPKSSVKAAPITLSRGAVSEGVVAGSFMYSSVCCANPQQ